MADKEECEKAWRIDFEDRHAHAGAKVREKYNYQDFVPERDIIEKTTSIFFTVFRAHQKKVAAYHKSNGNFKNYARAMLRILDEHYQYKYDPGEEIFKENSYIFEFKKRFEIDLSSYREEEKKVAPSPAPEPKKTASKPRKKKEATKPVESAPTVSEAPKKEPIAEPKKPSIPSKDEIRKYCLISETGSLRDFTGKMDYVVLPDGINNILGGTFKRVKDKLRVVIIPEGVRSIEASTFADCPNLEEVHLPESLTRIEEKAFLNCKKLKTINFPKALTSIDSYAFNGCESLKKVDITSKCYYPSNIYMLPFPQGCEVRVDGVITNANVVENDPMPEITSKVISESFDNLIISGTVLEGAKKSMECIVVPIRVDTIRPNVFKYNGYALRLLALREGITVIPKDAFRELKNLEEVQLPFTLTRIEASAFYGCPKLKTIVFPDSLEYIGNSAFKNCTSLKKVVLPKNCQYQNANKYICSFPETCEVVFE